MVDTYLAAIFCTLADSEAGIVLSTQFMHKDQSRLIQTHSSGKVTFPADKTELKNRILFQNWILYQFCTQIARTEDWQLL